MSSIQVDSILDKFCGYSEKTKKSKCTTSVYNTQFVDGKETSKKMSDRTCMAPIIDIKRRKGDFVVVYLNFQTANNAHLSSFWNAFEEFGNSYNESFANSHVDYSNTLLLVPNETSEYTMLAVNPVHWVLTAPAVGKSVCQIALLYHVKNIQFYENKIDSKKMEESKVSSIEAKIMSEEARTEDLKSKIRDIDFSLKEFEEKKDNRIS